MTAGSAAAKPATEADGCSLAELLRQVSDALTSALPQQVWVRAEISEYRVNVRSGHAYLSLVEHDGAGREIAKANANLWRGNLSRLEGKFKQGTGGGLQAGIKVLLHVRVVFHPQYGFSLVIEDIDPSHTLGDMAAKVAAIRAQLKQAGLYDNNRRRPSPVEFTRVAVISPANAAGLGDFRAEADRMAQHGLCEFSYYPALFQGADAPADIVRALRAMWSDHKQRAFDLVCIIRGGGSAADLAWLNDGKLAAAVCHCPVPVAVGIGHERDTTILDEVAFKRFDTPSKVIGAIFQLIRNNAERAIQDMVQLLAQVRSHLRAAEAEAGSHLREVRTQALAKLEQQAQANASVLRLLRERAVNLVERSNQEVENRMKEVVGLGPQATLRRGFALVRDPAGRPVSSAAQAGECQSLTLQFHDGELRVSQQGRTDEGSD